MAFGNFPVYLGAIGYKLTENFLAQGKVFIAFGRRKFGNGFASTDLTNLTEVRSQKALVIVAREVRSNKSKGFSN
jgi:hypothetical protein